MKYRFEDPEIHEMILGFGVGAIIAIAVFLVVLLILYLGLMDYIFIIAIASVVGFPIGYTILNLIINHRNVKQHLKNMRTGDSDGN
jgi:hypothetical protein